MLMILARAARSITFAPIIAANWATLALLALAPL